MSKPIMRTRIKRVAHDTSACLVRRAIVERLHPAGGRWIRVAIDEDPVVAHERDLEAVARAAAWVDRPEHGYARWLDEGPTWIEPYVEGDIETLIPARPR